jgi:hypothetical protein
MMWFKFIKKYGFRNITSGSQIIGFQFKIHLPYYCGLWVSQAFQDLAVRVDGVNYPKDKVNIKVGDRVFRWADIDGAYDTMWYVAEPATIMVEKPGGLTMGVHKVECDIHYMRSYSTIPEDALAGKTKLFIDPKPGATGGGFTGNTPATYEWHKCAEDLVLVI